MLFGAHVSSSGGIHTAIDRAEEFGCDAVQVFTQSPRAWRPTNHKPESFERFKERRAETGIGAVVCHALYLVNLASPDDELYRKSVDSLRNTIEVACGIEADAVSAPQPAKVFSFPARQPAAATAQAGAETVEEETAIEPIGAKMRAREASVTEYMSGSQLVPPSDVFQTPPLAVPT